MAGLPARAGGARALRRGTRDLRRPPRPQGGDRDRLRRRLVAALRGIPRIRGWAAGRTSCASCSRACRRAPRRWWRRRCARSSSSRRRRRCTPSTPASWSNSRRSLPRGRGDARRGGAGGPRVHGLPGRALEAGLVEQPAGAPSMRDGLSARPTWRPPSPTRCVVCFGRGLLVMSGRGACAKLLSALSMGHASGPVHEGTSCFQGALPAQPRPRWDRRSVAVARVRHHVRGWSSLLARRSPPPAAIPSMLCGLAGRGVA